MKVLEAATEIADMLEILSRADDEDDLTVLTGFEFELDLQGSAGIEASAGLAGETGATKGGGIGERAVATDEFGAVGGKRAGQFAAGDKGDAVLEIRVIGILRE